jgi:hypothetical protein
MEIVNKITFHQNKVYIEIDSDFNINKRYQKPFSRWLRKSLLNTIIADDNDDTTYTMKFSISKAYIKIIFYASDGETEHICLTTSVKTVCCSSEAVEILKQYELLNVLAFEIIYNELKGVYYCSFSAVKRKYVELAAECCVCLNPNQLSSENGFFKCGHIETCVSCYSKLAISKCPICRSI